MININVNSIQIKRIEDNIGNFRSKAPSVLKIAINNTAKQTRTDLAKEAKNTYQIKMSKFNKAMKIKNASVSNTEAIIRATGSGLEIADFKVSPFTYRTGSNRPDVTKGKVLTASGMKILRSKEIKAFVAKFQSGHVAVVQRVPGKRMKSNPNKEFLKKILSPSIPQMIGNEERVYGKVYPETQRYLQDNIQRQINVVLGG